MKNVKLQRPRHPATGNEGRERESMREEERKRERESCGTDTDRFSFSPSQSWNKEERSGWFASKTQDLVFNTA